MYSVFAIFELSFHSHKNSTDIHMKSLHTITNCNRQAEGNSETAYYT